MQRGWESWRFIPIYSGSGPCHAERTSDVLEQTNRESHDGPGFRSRSSSDFARSDYDVPVHAEICVTTPNIRVVLHGLVPTLFELEASLRSRTVSESSFAQ